MELLKTNASSFHKRFYDFLKDELRVFFRQEVNVKELVPSYSYSNHHVDFYIPSLECVVEIHGQQHYNPGFGDSEIEWAHSLIRDSDKANALTFEGYVYIVISYKEKDISSFFHSKYLELSSLKASKIKKPLKQDERRIEINKKNKEYNKELYRKLKEKGKTGFI